MRPAETGPHQWSGAMLAVLAVALAACASANDAVTTHSLPLATSIASSTDTDEGPGLLSESRRTDVRAIAIGPSELVAVGNDPRRPDVNEAAVWVSSDGSEWSRVDSDPSFIDSSMTDVVWFPPQSRYVAVGNHVSEGAIWLSPDGRSWNRVALFAFSNPPGGIEIDAIVVTAVRELRAIGREWLSEGEAIPAEWTSRDGLSWERLDLGDGR